MRVTPLDIIQKQFAVVQKRGGYDPDEVRTFLDSVRESMEDLLRENQRQREELGRREAEVNELRSSEGDIKDTLNLARRLAEDLKETSRREADVIVGEARLESERILLAITEERRELQAELVHLKAARARLLADMRASVEVASRLITEIAGEER
jgi:cell division initiation protein